ncbi:MAG: carbohydrate ABC transporter permease [Chloroflexi bacterium]|nr:MAG: carbohydrate ABC transporter permease [Chloroflexota bacterium]
MAAITVDKVTQQPSPRGAIVAKQVGLYVAMTLFGLIMLGPFILAIFGAFKSSVEVNSYPPTLLPQIWHPENFVDVARLFPQFPRWFVNSIGLSATVTVLNVFFCALAGYAFARLNFPGRTVLFLAVLATLMIPLQVTLIPKFIILKQLGLIDTYPAVILPNISTAAGIFLMTQFMKAIPHELEEAAVIDGASKWTVFTRVVLPLSVPAMTTLAIFSFQGQWNDFLWPLVVLNDPTLFTLPLGIAGFSTEHIANTNWVLVGSIFTTLPMVFLVFFFQRYIIKSVATTGGK